MTALWGQNPARMCLCADNTNENDRGVPITPCPYGATHEDQHHPGLFGLLDTLLDEVEFGTTEGIALDAAIQRIRHNRMGQRSSAHRAKSSPAPGTVYFARTEHQQHLSCSQFNTQFAAIAPAQIQRVLRSTSHGLS